RIVVLATLALALASGCNSGPCGLEPNKLDGSIGELLDITSDSVQVKQVTAKSISVSYFHGDQTVAKISVDITGEKAGAAIPILDPRQIVRLTSPASAFPNQIDAGQLTFTSNLNPGQNAEGCFAVRFKELDGTKRSLSGAFEAKLDAAQASTP